MAYNVFPGARRSDTFSLAWKPYIPNMKHVEPTLSEKPMPMLNHETTDRLVKQKGTFGKNAGAPLCPLLPALKRNKNNKLAFYLDDDKSRAIRTQ